MLGFTKQEQGIVLFLIFSLLVGCLVSLYNRYIEPDSTPQVDGHFIKEFHKRTQAIESAMEYEAINNIPETTISGSSQGEKSDAVLQATDGSESGELSANSGTNKYLININNADQQELQNIPQIGPVLAKRIVEYRGKIGEFKSVADLEQVKGIGPAKLKKIEAFISIK
jgi:comEA protein